MHVSQCFVGRHIAGPSGSVYYVVEQRVDRVLVEDLEYRRHSQGNDHIELDNVSLSAFVPADRVTVELTWTFEYVCEFYVAPNADIKTKVEQLVPDDFREDDKHQNVVVRKDNIDITGDIQPQTPRLNP